MGLPDSTAQSEQSVPHVSASQISTYRLCPRKWGFNKLDGIKPPENKYAERGKAVHALLENWLKDGVPIDVSTEYGKIAAAGLKFLPAPGTGLVEHTFTFATQIATYLGLWDLWEPAQATEEPWHVTSRVIDHKTTSDFKWLKLPDELRKDPQVVLYAVAAAAMAENENTHIELNWVYYRANAKKPGARKVQLHVLPQNMELPPRPKDVLPEHYGSMDYQELSERFSEIEQTAAELLEHHRQGRRGADLEYNVEACNAYGGCPYRGEPCKLTIGQMIRGAMAQEETLAERMAAAQAAKHKSAGSGTNGASAPAAAAPAAGGGDLAAKMKAANAASAASTEAKTEAAAETTAAAAQSAPAAVNPPESTKTPPTETPELPPGKIVQEPAMITIRDHFAAAALQGLIAARDATDAATAAKAAYKFADAMLKARG